MNKKYSFKSTWHVPASVAETWTFIHDSLSWPNWWSDVEDVKEIKHGDEEGIGSIRTYRLKSGMGYTLEFDFELKKLVERALLEGWASGELEGYGAWEFEPEPGGCCVTCIWEVSTNVWWMNLLSGILAPVFRFNHHMVMKRGEAALRNALLLVGRK